MTDKITIVIPNYNGCRYLKECLETLLADRENAPAFRVLVVDNGSTDDSCTFVREQFPQVELLALPENTGFCGAVNVGIKASRTPYVVLLNNDTKVKSGFITNLYRAIEGDEKVFSVSARTLMWDDPNRVDDAGDRFCALGWAFARGKGKRTDRYDTATEVFSACGCAAIYRRSVFDEIGLFDELHFAYLEDLDIGYRAQIYGYRNLYEPKAQVIHYGSASSGSRYNEFKTRLVSTNNIYLIHKNMPLLQRIWNLPFLVPGFLIKNLFFAAKGMGVLYAKGVLQGLKRSYSAPGKAHKVPFRLHHLPNYCRIQLQLYANLIRFLMKS